MNVTWKEAKRRAGDGCKVFAADNIVTLLLERVFMNMNMSKKWKI